MPKKSEASAKAGPGVLLAANNRDYSKVRSNSQGERPFNGAELERFLTTVAAPFPAAVIADAMRWGDAMLTARAVWRSRRRRVVV